MDLVRLCKRNRDGAFGTQTNRQRGLTAMGAELTQLGYKLKCCRSIKPKHVTALINHWQDSGLTKATMRNRMSWLRWWAMKVDKTSILDKRNVAYELNEDRTKRNNRAFELDANKLNTISCPYVRAAIMLQAAFGLRREEALKFQPNIAIKKDCIMLKGSWTKGGRPRTIPITAAHQRVVLNAVQQIAGNGALIPPASTYAEHLKRYERSTYKAGFKRLHGLRHHYSQNRYFHLTNMHCPLRGGPRRSMLSEDQYELDRQARQRIAKELGHNRLDICDIYIGALS